MPQELRVVCCCSCEMFQSDIVKKANKWTCKVCQEKQSLQKVYFLGSGKECRKVTQELNMRRSQLQGGKLDTERAAIKEEGVEIDVTHLKCENFDETNQVIVKSETVEEDSNMLETSKWDCFLTNNAQEKDQENEFNSSNLLVVKDEVHIREDVDKTKTYSGCIKRPNEIEISQVVNDHLKRISPISKENCIETPIKRFKVEEVQEIGQIKIGNVVEARNNIFEDINEDISSLLDF